MGYTFTSNGPRQNRHGLLHSTLSLTTLQLFSAAFAALGTGAFIVAIRHERLMQRHRQPGVSYRDVTLRRDGGWRRTDLFAPEGLVHQRRASTFGVAGVLCWLAAIVVWILATRQLETVAVRFDRVRTAAAMVSIQMPTIASPYISRASSICTSFISHAATSAPRGTSCTRKAI